MHVVPKKGGFTVIRNEKNELIPTRTVTGWRVCIDYRKLNTATKKDHFPLPFIDQMLDRLGASSSSPSTLVRVPGQALSPLAKVPKALSLQPHSGSSTKEKDFSGRAAEQPSEIMPITIWNPPAQSVKLPSSRVEELKRKGSKTDGDDDSLLLNVELATGAISSILKDSDLKRSGALPVEEALALSLQGVASVSSCILPCLILT